MAKYYYDVHKIEYSQGTGTFRTFGEHTFNRNPLTGTLTARFDYYPSIGFHINEGFYGTGIKITKKPNDYPPVGYYAINSRNAYQIMDSFHDDIYNDLTYYGSGVGKRGVFVETIVAEDGTYPNNGSSDNLWYVKGGLVFPELKMRINGQLKTSENGWVKVNGQLREIDTIWTRINGALKEVQ